MSFCDGRFAVCSLRLCELRSFSLLKAAVRTRGLSTASLGLLDSDKLCDEPEDWRKLSHVAQRRC